MPKEIFDYANHPALIMQRLEEELKKCEQSIDELEMEKNKALGQPKQFVDDLLGGKIILPPTPKVASILHCFLNENGIIGMEEEKSALDQKKRKLANSRLDLEDIRKRLDVHYPRAKLKLRIPPAPFAPSDYQPAATPFDPPSTPSSPNIARSTLAPAPTIGRKTVHFTKTRVSGGFYLFAGGRSLNTYNANQSQNQNINHLHNHNNHKSEKSKLYHHLDQIVQQISIDKLQSEEYEELNRLLRLKHSKETRRRKTADTSFSIHSGYRCDGCEKEPIMGIRWTCVDCSVEDSIDLCNNCFWQRHKIDILSSGSHEMSHRFREATATPQYWDDSYDYLDPNSDR